MSLSKTSKLLQYINFRMRVTILDGRQMVGRFMAFDKHMNLVLGDCEEFRKLPSKKGQEAREERRVLGLLLLRGDEVLAMTIEGPPPTEDMRAAKSQAPTGAGMGRAAGRGIAAAPGQAPTGLGAPAYGVGGPAPGMMMPRPHLSGAPQMAPSGPPGMGPPAGMRPGMPPPGVPPPGVRPGMPPPGMMPPPGSMPPGGPPM